MKKIKLYKTEIDEYGYEDQIELFFEKSVIERYVKDSDFESMEEFLENYNSDDTIQIEDMQILGI